MKRWMVFLSVILTLCVCSVALAVDCATTGVEIWMPAEHYDPGDKFSLTVYTCNTGNLTYGGVSLFVVFDLFDNFFWFPSLSSEIDYYTIDLVPGLTGHTIIPGAAWPEMSGTGEAWIIAVMTDPELWDTIGDLDTWRFTW